MSVPWAMTARLSHCRGPHACKGKAWLPFDRAQGMLVPRLGQSSIPGARQVKRHGPSLTC